MQRTLKAIEWASIATGWVLIFIGIALGLGPSAFQLYLERESSQAASTETSMAGKVRLPLNVVAKLSCPRFGRQFFVFPNGDSNLMKGPVTLTPPPSRSFSGNSIIAAHRDLHFRFLKDVRVGDEFRIQSRDGEYRYRISQLQIVEISDRALLTPSRDRVLTLVTCYPFYFVGSAPQRFIVRAIPIDDGKRQSIAD